MFQISVTRPTVPTASNLPLKIPTGTGVGSLDNNDLLKISADNGELSSDKAGETARKVSSSYQQVLRPSEEQFHASALKTRVESDGGSDANQYKVVKPLYSAPQHILVSGSPSSSEESDKPEETSRYETGQEYQPTATKETGSFSYQLLELGGSSVGTKASGTAVPVLLPIVTESPDAESEKKSVYKNDEKLQVISYTNNENSAPKFGDRIPNVSSNYIPTLDNVQQDQNEIQKGKKEHTEVTSLPIPRHSSLRPIIVADIYTKQHQQTNEPARPTIILPTTTAASVHVPEPTSIVSFYGSGHPKSGSIFTSKQEIVTVQQPATNFLSNPQAVSLAYSAASESSSQSSGSVTNNDLSGNILSQISAPHKPLSDAYTKDITVTQSLSKGSLPNSTGSVEEVPALPVEPLLSSSPAPVVVTYADGSTGVQEMPAHTKLYGQEASNPQQRPSSVFIYYSPVSTYSPASSSKATETSNTHRPLVTGVYSTPESLSPSQPQGSLVYLSSGKDENVLEQSITTATNREEHHIKSESLSPTSEYISDSARPTSFSTSNSIGSSQSSTSVTTINNAESGHITGSSVHSTTPPPEVISHSSSDAVSSEGYVLSPDTILLKLNSQPVAAALISSSEILAPVQQAGVSLGTVSHGQPTALSGVTSASTLTSQPPQVRDEIQDTRQPKTVVEVQKAVSFDFHSLAHKPDENHKTNSEEPTPGTPISYIQDVVERGKQIESNNDQHHIINGNVIEYGYGQPLTGLKVYPQIGYSLPRPIGFAEQLLYEYNPQVFDAQKLTTQQRKYTEKQKPGLSQTIQVTEGEKTGAKYQFNHQLEGSLQPYQQLNDIENQQEATVNQQQLNGGKHTTVSHLLPEVGQSVQTEPQIKKYHASVQIDNGLKYQQPFEIGQTIQNQPPTDISQQLIYQLFGQQVHYKEPVGVNQQIEFLTPVSLNEPVEQAVNTATLQFGYRLHDNLLPEDILHTTHKIAQGSKINGQSTNHSQLAYASPGKVSEQLQSEYNHQLQEEEKQEEVRFNNEIGKALKQARTEHEDGSRTQVPTHILKEGNIIPLSVAIEVPTLPPTTPQQVLELERPLSIEHTKLVSVEKPVPLHHTRVVEKPIPVPHAVPVEITKLVPVDRPVPFPQPFAVPHPVPVPYAVPHPIGVPVPHLVPYPHLVTVPYKELHPVYFRNGKTHKHELALYGHQVLNLPSNTPLPILLKALQYNGGRYGEPVSIKPHRFHFPRLQQPVYLTPPPLKSSGRGLQQSKHFDNFSTLCVEYGFKPPLVPSLQIDEIPPSAFGPPKKV
jgi:hypothetical protein